MSEETTAPAAVEAPAEVVTAAPVETTTAAVETTPETKVEAEKFAFPAKFLKADGTPDHEKLAKSYVSLEKRLGAKPNVPAASVEDYEWDANGMDLNPERVSEFKSQVLEKGFTKEQYKFVMDSHKNLIEGMTSAFDAEKTEALLQEEWGSDFKANAKAAKAAFNEFAPSDANPHDPVWNHPAVMKMLARMGGELGEDSLAKVGKTTVSGESIDSQIAELRKDPNYFNDAKLQTKMQELYDKKYK